MRRTGRTLGIRLPADNGGVTGLRRAAVLLPFYRGSAGELRLILIRRTARGRHGGQIALPGGNREPSDPSMRDTALRETREELGLPAEEPIDVLEDLPVTRTQSTGYLVWPFVGRLYGVPQRWMPQASEVAEVLDFAVRDIANPATVGSQRIEVAQFRGDVPVRRVGGYPIWGLTLRILEPVLPRALAGEFPV